jgi:RNA recognition motif-containing protein
MQIYVGNLEYSITDQDLHDLFSRFGVVEAATVIRDRETGRSKGFGFVTMPNDAEAAKAIEELHQAIINNRQIEVNQARPKEPRPQGGAGRGGYGRPRYSHAEGRESR